FRFIIQFPQFQLTDRAEHQENAEEYQHRGQDHIVPAEVFSDPSRNRAGNVTELVREYGPEHYQYTDYDCRVCEDVGNGSFAVFRIIIHHVPHYLDVSKLQNFYKVIYKH